MPVLLPHQFLQQPQGRTFVNTANKLGKDISFLWNAADRTNDSTNEFILNSSVNGQDITTEATTRGIAMKAAGQGFYIASLNTRNTTLYTAGTLTTIRNPGTSFTFGVAFRIKTLPTSTFPAIDITNGGSFYHEIGVDSATSKIYSHVAGNSTILADNASSAGDWAYVVAVCKNGDFHMYVNGVKQASTTAGTEPSTSLTTVSFNPSNVSILHAFASRAVWTQDDVTSWTANPWQLFAPQQRRLIVSGITFTYSRPSADSTPLQWSRQPSTGTHFSAIDEVVSDPSDYLYAPSTGLVDTMTCDAISQPVAGTNITINFTSQGTVKIELLQSTTVIKTINATGGSNTITITPAEWASVTWPWTPILKITSQ